MMDQRFNSHKGGGYKRGDILFTSARGAGKTTLAMNMVREALEWKCAQLAIGVAAGKVAKICPTRLKLEDALSEISAKGYPAVTDFEHGVISLVVNTMMEYTAYIASNPDEVGRFSEEVEEFRRNGGRL